MRSAFEGRARSAAVTPMEGKMIRCFMTLVMAVVALTAAAGNPQAGEPAAFDASGPVNIDELFQLAQVTVPGRGCSDANDCYRQEMTCRQRCVDTGNFCHGQCSEGYHATISGLYRPAYPSLPFDDPGYNHAIQEFNRLNQQYSQGEAQAAASKAQCDSQCRNTYSQCDHTCSQIYGYTD